MILGSIYNAHAWGEGKIAVISDIDYKRKLLCLHECNEKGFLLRRKPVTQIYEFSEFINSVNNDLVRQTFLQKNQLYLATDWGKGIVSKIEKIYLNRKEMSVCVLAKSVNVRGYQKIMPIFDFEDNVLPVWKLIDQNVNTTSNLS